MQECPRGQSKINAQSREDLAAPDQDASQDRIENVVQRLELRYERVENVADDLKKELAKLQLGQELLKHLIAMEQNGFSTSSGERIPMQAAPAMLGLHTSQMANPEKPQSSNRRHRGSDVSPPTPIVGRHASGVAVGKPRNAFKRSYNQHFSTARSPSLPYR